MSRYNYTYIIIIRLIIPDKYSHRRKTLILQCSFNSFKGIYTHLYLAIYTFAYTVGASLIIIESICMSSNLQYCACAFIMPPLSVHLIKLCDCGLTIFVCQNINFSYHLHTVRAQIEYIQSMCLWLICFTCMTANDILGEIRRMKEER